MKPRTMLGVPGHPTEGRVFIETGEYRRPRAGEFYASDDTPKYCRSCVFVAPAALDAKYRIMTEVRA